MELTTVMAKLLVNGMKIDTTTFRFFHLEFCLVNDLSKFAI